MKCAICDYSMDYLVYWVQQLKYEKSRKLVKKWKEIPIFVELWVSLSILILSLFVNYNSKHTVKNPIKRETWVKFHYLGGTDM